MRAENHHAQFRHSAFASHRNGCLPVGRVSQRRNPTPYCVGLRCANPTYLGPELRPDQSLRNEPSVPPPYRRLQPHSYPPEIRVPAVDDDISLHAGDDRRDDQDGAWILLVPSAAQAASRFPVRTETFREGLGSDDRVAGALGYGDLYVVLVGRQGSVPVDEFFQHCRRVVLRSVYHFGAGLMPPSGRSFGALGAPHRKLARRIADPVCPHRLRQGSRRCQGNAFRVLHTNTFERGPGVVPLSCPGGALRVLDASWNTICLMPDLVRLLIRERYPLRPAG